MDELTDEQLIARVMSDHNVPRGKAIAELRAAWQLGEVQSPLDDLVIISSDWKAELKPVKADGSEIIDQPVHDLRWGAQSVEHMLWLVRQQLGEAKAGEGIPSAPMQPVTRRKGPIPGRTDKVAQAQRKLIPEIEARLERGAKSVTEAVRGLEGLLPGNGELENKIAALVKRYNREAAK
jgi:hypothetical protein